MCNSLISNKDRIGSGSSSSVSIGKEGILSVTNGTLIVVATTEAALDQITQSVIAKDNYGQTQMIAEGLIFFVDNGTKVLVIDYGYEIRKIRVLEGKMKGRDGYVPYEWVNPL